MTNKIIHENHSLSNILNKRAKKVIQSSVSVNLNHSRELFSMHMNDCFRISNDDMKLLDQVGIHSNSNDYSYLYSKNISLILRRYVYNVLCVNGVYTGRNKTISLRLVGDARIKNLEYTRTSNEFLDSCLKVLKERISDLGFYDESLNKTLKKYLYGQATPIGSNLKTKIAFYLGLHIDNLNYLLDCLEITKNPTSFKEDVALNFLKRLSNEMDPDYALAYEEYKTIVSMVQKSDNKFYFSNNKDFVELVDTKMNHQRIDDLLAMHEVELDRIIKKRKDDNEMDMIDDEWSKYLSEFRNDLLDDHTYKNIKKNNIPVKKRHVELLFFYDCLIHHEQYFKNGTHSEIMKYFVKPTNDILQKYGLALIDYSTYFDKFLVLCLLKQNPASLFNKILMNANYMERRHYD